MDSTESEETVESSSVSESYETSSSESEDVEEDEESSQADESSEAEESETEQTEPTQIGYEWVSDTEIMSTDGVISSSYEFSKDGNMLYVTVTITNNGDNRIVTSYDGSYLQAVTDLTEQGITWANPLNITKIEAGESVTFDSSWELEEGWSTADVSFYFRPKCTDETDNIEYSNEYSVEKGVGAVSFTLENE
ncbi:MAG: hypothetical protein LUE12_08460 [Ruminococcus sp.]|nr:hypothetical protein [Ruminococcus sp.]